MSEVAAALPEPPSSPPKHRRRPDGPSLRVRHLKPAPEPNEELTLIIKGEFKFIEGPLSPKDPSSGKALPSLRPHSAMPKAVAQGRLSPRPLTPTNRPQSARAGSSYHGSSLRLRPTSAIRVPPAGELYMQPKKPALLPSWPPDNPPTLKQMERDMMAWSAMRHQVEAIQYEGRMIEFRRASDAFEAVLARVAALEEGLKSECTRAEKASHLLDTAEQRFAQALKAERANAREALAAAEARVASQASSFAQEKAALTGQVDGGAQEVEALRAALFAHEQAAAARGDELSQIHAERCALAAQVDAITHEAAALRESLAANEQAAATREGELSQARGDAEAALRAELAAQLHAVHASDAQWRSKLDDQAGRSRTELEEVKAAHAAALADASGAAGMELQQLREASSAAAAAAAAEKAAYTAAAEAEKAAYMATADAAAAASLAELTSAREALEAANAASKARERALSGENEAVASEANARCERAEERVAEVRDELMAQNASEVAALTESLAQLEAAAAASQEAAQLEHNESRLALVQKQMVRRMLYRDLADGFSAWSEHWHARVYAMDKLRQVANRMRTPELANTFYSWQDDLEEARHAARVAGVQAQKHRSLMILDAREKELRALRFELDRLSPTSGGMVKKKQQKMARRAEAKQRAALN